MKRKTSMIAGFLRGKIFQNKKFVDFSKNFVFIFVILYIILSRRKE